MPEQEPKQTELEPTPVPEPEPTPEPKPKATNCPNCQRPAIRTGNEIACERCDAIFVITKKQGAKVKQIGISERLDLLEAEVFAEKTPTEPESEPEPEPEPEEPEGQI